MTAEQREKALSERNRLMVERYDSKAQELLPLAVGTNVVLQKCPDRNWNRTGQIVELMSNRQYCIEMFHFGQVTLRNSRFIPHYTPIIYTTNWIVSTICVDTIRNI